MPRYTRLVGSHEVGRMLGGLTRSRVDQLAATRGFPLPIATLKQGRVWDAPAVEKWARSKGRTLHDY